MDLGTVTGNWVTGGTLEGQKGKCPGSGASCRSAFPHDRDDIDGNRAHGRQTQDFSIHHLVHVTLTTAGEVAGPTIPRITEEMPTPRELESLVLGHPVNSGV